jgi:hypothetical protein
MKQRPPLKITGRTSSITNSFVQAIIPTVAFSAEEQREALAHLGMTPDDLHCAYCGAAATGEQKTADRLHQRNPQSRSFLRSLQSIEGGKRLARVDDG